LDLFRVERAPVTCAELARALCAYADRMQSFIVGKVKAAIEAGNAIGAA
jgi:hypothetical protein